MFPELGELSSPSPKLSSASSSSSHQWYDFFELVRRESWVRWRSGTGWCWNWPGNPKQVLKKNCSNIFGVWKCCCEPGDDHTRVALRGNAATGRRDLGEVRRISLRQRVARGQLWFFMWSTNTFRQYPYKTFLSTNTYWRTESGNLLCSRHLFLGHLAHNVHVGRLDAKTAIRF